MWNKTGLITLVLAAGLLLSSHAFGSCETRKRIDITVPVNNVIKLIKVDVGARKLKVKDVANSSEITILGKGCASSSAELKLVKVIVDQQGPTIVITTKIPPRKNIFRAHGGSTPAYADLVITVPSSIELEVIDHTEKK